VRGGADDPSNMQWQTVTAGKAKDKWERKTCQTGVSPATTGITTKDQKAAVSPVSAGKRSMSTIPCAGGDGFDLGKKSQYQEAHRLVGYA